MKIPCKNCLILPICRHKTIVALLNECELIVVVFPLKIKTWEEIDIEAVKTRREFEQVLKPTKWRLSIGGYISS